MCWTAAGSGSTVSWSTRVRQIPDWRAYDFLVVMGAAADVWDHDEYPWIAAEEGTVREAVLAGVPYFGVCFGLSCSRRPSARTAIGGWRPSWGSIRCS
jgi:GMP synthase-like glutamine amidotransferase